jgi:small Trp-rich protein
MLLIGLGVILLVLKAMGIDPVATWPWWATLVPFGLALAWWAWSDRSGYTKRRAIQQENARKEARIERQRQAMGTSAKPRR